MYQPGVVGERIDNWILDPTVQEEVDKEEMETHEVEGALKKIYARLRRSVMPLASIHGDFAQCTVGMRKDAKESVRYAM